MGPSNSSPARQGKGVRNVIPLYFRVYVVLEQRIRSGMWQKGQAMPSESDLAAEFGVSRVTIRNTMALLEDADLVIRQRGRGTFVNTRALEAQEADKNYSGFEETIRELERTTSVDLHEFAESEVPERLTKALGKRALRIRRTRRSDGRPFSYSICYVAPQEAALLSAETLGNRTVISALEAEGFVFTRADQRLTAVAADAEAAEQLEIEAGSPLLEMVRSVFDAEGRLVEFIQIYYRPDMYEYRVELSREQSGSRPPRWVQRD